MRVLQNRTQNAAQKAAQKTTIDAFLNNVSQFCHVFFYYRGNLFHNCFIDLSATVNIFGQIFGQIFVKNLANFWANFWADFWANFWADF